VFVAALALIAGLGVACPARATESAAPTPDSRAWAFQPLRPLPPPQPVRADWARNDLDRFLLASLEKRGLQPSPEAPRRPWIRRAYFDVLGLPPTAEESDAFESDEDPSAYERWADRLLASPHYGERWGRWWLDVARYADTNGQDENKVMANAWRYRDWVVRAFNANLAFDDFTTHQLAGDLLPPTRDEQEQADRLVATGFLVLGPKMLAEQDKPKLVLDIVDEQIDTVGRAFLGLTLGCARCHDHKFDPVPARDYYALAGIFRSTRTLENLDFVSKSNERRIATAAEVAAFEDHRRRFADLTNQIATVVREANAAFGESLERPPSDGSKAAREPRFRPLELQDLIRELELKRTSLEKSAPPAPSQALAAGEDRPMDLPVHSRGNHLQPAGDPVPRGFLQVTARIHPPPAVPTDRSGRLELARWIASPAHPLTARVFVNRVWQAYFGRGLVRTSDNFGFRGEPPSHPELLDWLADFFIRSGWDIKALHRLILTSAAYRQTSVVRPESAEEKADPENILLHRFPRRRLDAEMIRDGLLAVSGRLDSGMGGTLVNWKNDDYAPSDEVSARSLRRSVYLPIVRDRVFDVFTLFDFANPSVATPRRIPTVVSQQALFFMNSPLVRDAAEGCVQHLGHRIGSGGWEGIREAYRRILGRAPTAVEFDRARQFLTGSASPTLDNASPDTHPGTEPEIGREAWISFCQALLASNEFAYRP
jgi:hypothetical protein